LPLSSKLVDRSKNFFALGMMYWIYNRPLENTIDWLKSKFKKETNIIGFVSHVQGELKLKAQEAGCDMVLARSENSGQRFYSMSSQIRQERAAYYDILERTQRGTMDITPWMDWFLGCLGRAIEGAQGTLGAVLFKARFWEALADFSLNERQRLVLDRLLDGFEGSVTTSKWAKLAKCSQDTALRDILPLVERGFLVRNPGGGRSTSYALAKTPKPFTA
jgi:hypothetical protein